MGFVWFWLVAIMIVAYVVLDGFDLGVGVLHLFLVRNEEERKTTLASIGPVWDGNEVWLLAGGGTLYFAFPLLYASAFSGFYLPLMIVLWLLVLRGISLELRNHIDVGVWRTLLDGVFGLASALLTIFYGAALANVLRGVPLNGEGYFFLPLWTNWKPGPAPGILDWYTVIGGLVALVALTMHGALWLSVKTSGELEQRAQKVVTPLWGLLVALTAVSLLATIAVRPASLDNYFHYPVTFVVPAGVVGSLIAIWFWNRTHKAIKAFVASCAYLFFMLAGACWGVYPVLLPATTGPDNDITLSRAISGPHTLAVGLVWWLFGMVLATGYVVFVYSRFKGKADVHAEGH
ncbi:Cytochrome d ubiquinol oxidase, subunit II [Candidatus Sulfotelmatomonas gaucii]|uniref:Cytochrome d ubiquinol oxidase, subunit II n=1 Tax=Candidatus Sulfuritelmatomonas gaucii TaxID=2043161 RepID=A0A2N9L4H4_9BACT|nr:Cytochrome d ubiquinol oxidase, subunit II [Candidatus Sulfotelmatomonas gaucii]